MSVILNWLVQHTLIRPNYILQTSKSIIEQGMSFLASTWMAIKRVRSWLYTFELYLVCWIKMAGECQVGVQQILAVLLCVIGNIPVNADTNRRNCVGKWELICPSYHLSAWLSVCQSLFLSFSSLLPNFFPPVRLSPSFLPSVSSHFFFSKRKCTQNSAPSRRVILCIIQLAGVGISQYMSTFQQITENESITVSCELITSSECNAVYRRFWLIQSKRNETSIDIEHLADPNTQIKDNPYHAMDIQMNNFTLTLQGLTANLEYILLHCGAQEMDTEDEHEVLARDVIFIEIMLPTTPPVTCTAPIISNPVQTTMEPTPVLVQTTMEPTPVLVQTTMELTPGLGQGNAKGNLMSLPMREH